MKKNCLIAFTLLTVLLTFAGCDKINDIVFKDFTLTKKTVEIPVILVASGSGEEFSTFEGKYDGLNLENEIFSELKDYLDKPIELSLDEVSLKFNKVAVTSGGNAIRNLKATATDKDADAVIKEFSTPQDESIVLENGYKNTDLTAFLQAVIKALQDKKTINFEASGETNMIPSDGEGAILGNLEITIWVYAKVKL